MLKPFMKLRGKIVEVFGSIRDFSKVLGISEQSLVAKLNARTPFKQSEIVQWCNLLGIPKDQIHEYFFCEETYKFEC